LGRSAAEIIVTVLYRRLASRSSTSRQLHWLRRLLRDRLAHPSVELVRERDLLLATVQR
jgi:hypothetical protein